MTFLKTHSEQQSCRQFDFRSMEFDKSIRKPMCLGRNNEMGTWCEIRLEGYIGVNTWIHVQDFDFHPMGNESHWGVLTEKAWKKHNWNTFSENSTGYSVQD